MDKDARQKLIENFNAEIKSYLDHFDIEEDFFNPEERNIILDFILSEGNDSPKFWAHQFVSNLEPSEKYFGNRDLSSSRSLLER